MASKELCGLLTVIFCSQAVFGVAIVSKSEWGGRAATSKSALANNLRYAVIHHTAGAYCSTKNACSQQIRNIQNYHQKTLGWADVGYNFLIGGDGNVYEGRGWNVMGAHATNWNSISLGIALVGNHNNDQPNSAQIAAAKNLLADAVARGQLTPDYILYGHRQVGNTECPGNNLYNQVKTWPNWRA